MPQKIRYSASEIATMKLPGLPTTKARVIERAASEGWAYEEQKGRGGTRRVYEVPDRYLVGTSYAAPQVVKDAAAAAGTIVAGSAKVDPEKLASAIRALAEWEKERGVTISEERRPAVIAVLYDYLQRGDNQDLSLVLKALG